VQSYQYGERADLITLEKCRISGTEHVYNYELLRPSGYANTIFEADCYEAKVGWVLYKKPVKSVESEEKGEKGEKVKNEIVAIETNLEEKKFLALVLKRHIFRSKEDLKLARRQGRTLSTEFSCDIPVALIPRLYTTFAKLYRLQGGSVPNEYPLGQNAKDGQNE